MYKVILCGLIPALTAPGAHAGRIYIAMQHFRLELV